MLTLCELLVKRYEGENRCLEMLQVFDILWSSARSNEDLACQPRLLRLLSSIVSVGLGAYGET